MGGTEVDSGADSGVSLGAFRGALKLALIPRQAKMHGMGLYRVAMAAGCPGLGGFAPVIGAAMRRMRSPASAVDEADFVPVTNEVARRMGQTYRPKAVEGEASAMPVRSAQTRPDRLDLNALPAARADSSYRAIVARARAEAVAGRARRAAERVADHLPPRNSPPAEMSFAPQPGGATLGGALLDPNGEGLARLHSLRPHSGVTAAMAFAPLPGSAAGDRALPDSNQRGPAALATSRGSGGLHDGGTARPAFLPAGEAGGQQFALARPIAEAAVAPLDFDRALEDYFFRKSRLPPAGGAGFNPLLSPVWAGLKIPG